MLEYAWFVTEPEWTLDMVLGWQAKIRSLGVVNQTFPNQFKDLAFVTTHRVVDHANGNNHSEVVVLWTMWRCIVNAFFDDQNL